MDETQGVLTTQKIQALLDTGFSSAIRSRRDLAVALAEAGEQISAHGVEAWFRHVDSNYNFKRQSLSGQSASYPVPKRRWPAVLKVFGIEPRDLDLTDATFRKWCLEQIPARSQPVAKRDIALAPRSSLIAREPEYRAFLAAFESAQAGRPAMLLLEGDPGLGKTRLISEFNLALDATDCLRLSASCAEDGEIPLLPIVDLIRINLQKISPLEGGFVEQFEELYRDYIDGRSLWQRTPQLFLQLSNLLLEIAQQRTLVVTLDDLQWADEATLRFLLYLWQNAVSGPAARFAMLGAVRREADSGWASFVDRVRRYDGVQIKRLEPMNLDDLGALLNTVTGLPVSSGLLKIIWEHSLGNAFYGLEILKCLKQDNHLFERNGRTDTVVQTDQLQVQGDVGAIYQERFNALTETTQTLLLHAAALNYNFNLEQIQLLFPKEPLQVVLDSIEEAEHQGFLAYQNDRFQFEHPIIRQAIYQLASETRRARIHCNIADHIRHDKRSPSEYRDIEVAHHLRKGRMLADQKLLVTYCYKAAQLAKKLAAWDQMIQFSQTALSVTKDGALTDIQRAELLACAGGGLHQSGRPAEAIEMLKQAKQRFAEAGDQVSYARALNEMVRVRGNFGIAEPGEVDEIEELQKLASHMAAAQPKLASRMLDTVSARYMYANKPRKALEFSLKSLDAVRSQTACEERSLAAISAGVASLQWLEIDAAQAHFNESLDSAGATRDMPSTARALQRLAIVQFLKASFSDVALSIKRIRDVGRSISNTGEFTLALAMQLGVHAMRGEFAAAELVFEEGMELFRTSGYVWGKPYLLAGFSYVLLQQGRADEAMKTADELAQGERRAFGRLLTQMRAFMRSERDAKTLNGTTEGYVYLSFDGTGFDVGRIYRYGMDLQMAIRQGDILRAQTALDAIRLASSRGAVLSPGWPFLIPALIAEGQAFTGDLSGARYHLAIAAEVALRRGLAAEIDNLIAVGRTLWDEDEFVLKTLRAYPRNGEQVTEGAFVGSY